ncbi:MAG: hypothetical protein P1U42_06345 [Phycisphaerales bacterium]|nr:hypothetical protein [Phycisphaerales bacterium]
MTPMFIILGVAAAIGLIVLAVKAAAAAAKRQRERIEAMAQFADRMGFSFNTGHDSYHDEEFSHFEVFTRGFDRAAYNTLSGMVDLGAAMCRCKMGDFTYKTRETYTTTDSKGRTTTRTRIVTHYFSYFILELPYPQMPNLKIRREGIFDKIASAFGKNDIDFESSEFSRKYHVKCKNRKFAYDIIHPRMIEFMLETKPGAIDIEQSRICLTDGFSTWPSERFEGSLGWTLRFLEHWPEFVVKDLEEGKIS